MFNFTSNRQLKDLIAGFHGGCYQRLYNASCSRPGLVRFGALPIALSLNLLHIAARVSRVAESAIKGVVNIFGCLFFQSCHFSTGFNQFFIEIPKHFILLPFSTVNAIFKTYMHTIKILIDPKSHTEKMWGRLDPSGFKYSVFQTVEKAVKDCPENPVALRKLGDCYLNGIGTEINLDEGIKWTEEAANRGDVESMWQLAEALISAERINDAIHWLEKAAAGGHVPAAIKIAKIYQDSRMPEKALDYYRIAAERRDLHSMVEYYLLIWDCAKAGIAFGETRHTRREAFGFLSKAAVAGSGKAVAVIALEIYMKAVLEEEQEYGPPLADSTKSKIKEVMTPGMLYSFREAHAKKAFDCEELFSRILPERLMTNISITNSILRFLDLEYNKISRGGIIRSNIGDADAASRVLSAILRRES